MQPSIPEIVGPGQYSVLQPLQRYSNASSGYSGCATCSSPRLAALLTGSPPAGRVARLSRRVADRFGACRPPDGEQSSSFAGSSCSAGYRLRSRVVDGDGPDNARLVAFPDVVADALFGKREHRCTRPVLVLRGAQHHVVLDLAYDLKAAPRPRRPRRRSVCVRGSRAAPPAAGEQKRPTQSRSERGRRRSAAAACLRRQAPTTPPLG